MRGKLKRMAHRAMLFAYLILPLLFLSGCERALPVYETWSSEESASGPVSGVPEPAGTGGEIAVYICGEVRNEGVYLLKPGSRVCDAVEAAGGLLPGADKRCVNQARLLSDGEQITILSEVPEENASVREEADGRININLADEKELQALNGIGEARARDIVAYRKEHGSFKTAEEIMNVSGIKSSLYERIRDDITVG